MLLWIWLVHNTCWKLECWLYIFTTTRANRVCKSFFFITFSLSTELLEDKQRINLGGVDTSPSYLLFQTLLPLFWTLICMIWMKLTRTDAVFSRTAMVLFIVHKTKFLGMTWKSTGITFGKYKKYWRKNQGQGPTPCPRGWGRAPFLVVPLRIHRRQLQLYIFMFGQKKIRREGFIAFYDTGPLPSPNLSREGWSGVCSGLQRGGFVAVVIINHPP